MTLTAARLPACTDPSGNLIALFDQDRSLWNRTQLSEGNPASRALGFGYQLNAYNIEAAIASVHAMARCAEETDLGAITGIVTLTSKEQRWQEVAATYDLCRMADVRLLSPYFEGVRPEGSVSGGCHQVSSRTEMAVDESVSSPYFGGGEPGGHVTGVR